MLFRSALIAGASLAVAQSISSNCSSALLSVAASPDATCLNLALLAPVLNTPNTSVISTVNNWLTGLCNKAPCSNTTLQAVVTNITAGCSSDLSGIGLNIGLNISGPSSILKTVEAAYPVVRQVGCLKDTATNTLCAVESLTALKSATASLSYGSIIGFLTQGTLGRHISFPQNATCSDCSKAAFTILSQDFPAFLPSNPATFQAQCGSSFTDGQMPSSVQETATNTTTNTTPNTTPSSTPKSGAASRSVSRLFGVAILIIVPFAFATLA